MAATIEFVCSDRWNPYLRIIREECSRALDDIRSAQARRTKRDGYEPVLTKSCWRLLKRLANLTANQKGEAEIKVMPPIHPGETLPVTRINDIVRGKRSITADTALCLARYFETTPQFWMNLQA